MIAVCIYLWVVATLNPSKMFSPSLYDFSQCTLACLGLFESVSELV